MTTRRLNATHLKILAKINKGKVIIDMPNIQGFRFKGERTMYGWGLLNALRDAGYLNKSGAVTADGVLWLTINQAWGVK